MANHSDFIVDLSRAIPGETTELWLSFQDGRVTEEKQNKLAEFTARVVTGWPFDVPISAENYLNLGIMDARAVDEAVSKAVQAERGRN